VYAPFFFTAGARMMMVISPYLISWLVKQMISPYLISWLVKQTVD